MIYIYIYEITKTIVLSIVLLFVISLVLKMIYKNYSKEEKKHITIELNKKDIQKRLKKYNRRKK